MNVYPEHDMTEFWSKVYKTNRCWFWTGPIDKGGYGIFYKIKGELYVHRIAWKTLQGDLPKNKPELDHKCKNRNCVNPSCMLPTNRSGNMKNTERGGKRKTYLIKDSKEVYRIQKDFCIHGHNIRGSTLDVLTDGRVVCSNCNKLRKIKKIDKIIIKNDEITISEFCKHGERLFGSVWKSAIKTKMYIAGHDVFGKTLKQALRYLEKYDIPLEAFAANYNLTETKTRLRAKPFEESKS